LRHGIFRSIFALTIHGFFEPTATKSFMLSGILNAFRLVNIDGHWVVIYLASSMFAALLEAAGYDWLGRSQLHLFLSGLSITVILFFLFRAVALVANIWIAAAVRANLQLQRERQDSRADRPPPEYDQELRSNHFSGCPVGARIMLRYEARDGVIFFKGGCSCVLAS
jgi:hypothetical protein